MDLGMKFGWSFKHILNGKYFWTLDKMEISLGAAEREIRF